MVRVITARGQGSYTEFINREAVRVGSDFGCTFSPAQIEGWTLKLRDGSTDDVSSMIVANEINNEMILAAIRMRRK